MCRTLVLLDLLQNISSKKSLFLAADTSGYQYELYHVSKQHNITDNARMALCHSGVFVFLWGRNLSIFGFHCRSPPSLVQITHKNLNGGKANGNYHQNKWTGCVCGSEY